MYRTETAKITIHKVIPLLALLLLLTLTGCQQQTLHQQQFLQFGTLIDINLISSDEQSVNRTFKEIEQLLEQRHSQWHAWEDGILNDFNQALSTYPRTAVDIPQELIHLINLSKQYYDITQGRFNPALGKLVSAWGFHQQQAPDLNLIHSIKRDIPDMWELLIENNRALSINPHLQLDFGAIAKGTVIKQIAQLLKQRQLQNFIINAGGDIYAAGQKHQRSWRVAIEDPFKQGTIATLSLPPSSSIFTSGNYRRFYIDDQQQRRHHIIDPTSGDPALNISAATVIHQDPEIADIAATTLMLTPINQLQQMAHKLGIEDFLVLTQQKQAYISQSMLNRVLWKEPVDLTIHALQNINQTNNY